MKWEDYKRDEDVAVYGEYVKTDIECPKCGEYIYQDVSVQYMTNPPQHDFYCFGCGWKGRK